MQFINFQTLSVQVQNLTDIGKVTINMSDNPASWQASFISPTYYPPGTEIDILDLPFIVTTVSKQTANIYQYSAYLKASILDMSSTGKIDNTGAYERIPNTNPYRWSRLGDLTTAMQSIIRNRSQNTLTTPFEKSFDRFESTINWTSDSIRSALSELYISSQTLVIPWYNVDTQQIDWITIDDWVNQMPISTDNITITHINTIGKPRGVKIFAKNRYKHAVTMYECPVSINPSNELLDVGFYVMACDGDKNPTVRFTYNYNVNFNFMTRISTKDEYKDNSGMVTITEETSDDGSVTTFKPNYWYEDVGFDDEDGSDFKNISKLVQLYLKSLVFVANPIITFDSEDDYLDSYFPYPISPWNFQLYLKPTNTGKWIPSSNPYPIYDMNLINSKPDWVWTGAYCSVVRISTLPQTDSSMQKEIVHQGFYVNGFNVGNTLTPFSLLTVENQTQMPIIADDVVKSYLSNLSVMPNVPYKVHMISGLQKNLYQYGMTIDQVTDNENAYPSKTLTLDLSTNSLSIDDEVISSSIQSYKHVHIYMCYESQGPTTNPTTRLKDEFNIGLIKILPPKTQQRIERCIIIVFSTAVYFITYRVFASPTFLCAPYVYKFDEDYTQTLTHDYDIIITSNYSSLISRIRQYIDKSIVFEWEGHIDEYPGFIPFRFFNGYAISQVNITIDGDYVKAICTADNRLRLYQKWSKILSDITPQKCDIEVYPRIPNKHYPTSKIYAFSDRTQKLQEYLNKILNYIYLDPSDTFEISII